MRVPPILRRDGEHKIGRAGIKSEKRLAKTLGARLTPASGAMAGAKGDMVVSERKILIEAKSTLAASLSLKLDWLLKIAKEARSTGKRPALTVSFITEDGKPRRDGQWVMVPLEDWKEMSGREVPGDDQGDAQEA